MKVLIVFALVLATGELSATPRGRILGGENASPRNFRYQALVETPDIEDSTFIRDCGGSVIDNRWVLTAAHCFDFGDTNRTKVFLGLTNVNVYTCERNATEVIIHEDYSHNINELINDIALIKMKFVQFNEYIQLVPLSDMVSLDNEVITMSGWGTINSTTDPTSMQYAMITVLNSTECARVFHELPATQFCTFSFFNSICPGDSGNPAVIEHGDYAKQVGIASFNSAYCAPNSTNGFTRTYSYLPWMRNKTRLNLNPNWRY